MSDPVQCSEACLAEPRLDPRVRRTRNLLKDALRTLLKERHLSEISVQDIAERATINRATFYAHFETKEALVWTMLEEDLREALRQDVSQGGRTGREALESFVTVILRFSRGLFGRCPRQVDEFALVVSRVLQSAIAGHLSGMMEHHSGVGRLFPGEFRERAVSALSWSIYGTAMEWCREDRSRSAEIEARKLVDFWLRQVPAP